MQNKPTQNPGVGDKVAFNHPSTRRKVEGTLVKIEGGRFYIIDDGVTRPMHSLAAEFARAFHFRVVDPLEKSLTE